MGRIKNKTLTNRLMRRFIVCMLALTALAIPVLYFITTKYYAEDLNDLIRDYGIQNPDLDLEKDTIVGLFIQAFVIIVILFMAVLVVMKYVPQRLWRPFHDTLAKVKDFKVEDGKVPQLAKTGTVEFDELNTALTRLMTDSVKSYKAQKEFTENASHELQTPIAIAQGKLDNLLQDANLTEHQALELQQVYQELRHMSRLSRSLLLISKIENNQYHTFKKINLCQKLDSILPNLESLAGDIHIKTDWQDASLTIDCNETLLESLLNNLIVNAVRHNRPHGTISITVAQGCPCISNTSDEPPIDPSRVFSRFGRTQGRTAGNGLGLAIVKSIAQFHHWQVTYRHEQDCHVFELNFNQPPQVSE